MRLTLPEDDDYYRWRRIGYVALGVIGVIIAVASFVLGIYFAGWYWA
jgi:hypothetical protein